MIEVVYTGELSAGMHQINWSTATLPKGMYILQVQSASNNQTIKLIKN